LKGLTGLSVDFEKLQVAKTRTFDPERKAPRAREEVDVGPAALPRRVAPSNLALIKDRHPKPASKHLLSCVVPALFSGRGPSRGREAFRC